MKIALYLGSFNPFHNAHLDCILKAFNDFKMDMVVIVPAMQNPWKQEKPVEMNKRVGIIKSSLKNTPGFYDSAINYNLLFYLSRDRKNKAIEINRIEEQLIPPYYTYATLHALKNKYCNHEVFILCGEDTINDIPKWMNGGAIIQDYDFLIVDRPEKSVSSTEIRRRIKQDEDFSDLVNVNIVKLIKKYYK